MHLLDGGVVRLTDYLGRERVVSPSKMVPINEAVNIDTTPTVLMISISIARSQEEVISRPMPVLKYGYRKVCLFTYTPYVPSGLSISICV